MFLVAAFTAVVTNALPVSASTEILYVDQNAAGAEDGTSWADAFTDLQSALATASTGTEIWVAAGTYKPVSDIDRSVSFALKNDVAVYGGFAGTETLLSQRNYETNITTLSGNLGDLDEISDNSYHVVIGSGTNSSAVLDGFTVRDGNADDSAPISKGGGIYNYHGSPTIRNMIFTDNAARFGGGMFNDSLDESDTSNPTLLNVRFINNSAAEGGGMENMHYSSPTLTNVIFQGNTAIRSGGGLLNFYQNSTKLVDVTFDANTALVGGGLANIYSNPTLDNVTFSNNTAELGGGLANGNSSLIITNATFHGNAATQFGGAIYNEQNSIPSLLHVTLSGNSAATNGGGIYSDSNGSNTTVVNSILYGNSGGEIYNSAGTSSVTNSIVQGGYTGTGNLDADPLLGPLQANGGFTQTMAPGAGSPAIDAAEAANCPDVDQRDIVRPQGNGCDMGAVEAFPVSATKPGVPVLISPANGALVDSLQPALDWKDSVPAAFNYQLQISTNKTFSGLVLNQTGLATSNLTLNSDLSPGKQYYWRVRGLNVGGAAGAWSTVWNFKTPLSKPDLVSPLNASSLLTDRPLFKWEDVDGATGYNIQVSISDKFDTLLVNAPVANPEYLAIKDLPQNKVLHWRVRAKTSVVKGPWSDKWSFTSGNPPSVPILISPIGNILLKDFTPLFDWKNSTLPMPANSTVFKRYQIQVDDDQDFSSTVIDDTTAEDVITASNYIPVGDLISNTQYYWRVRAYNSINAEEHSSGWSAIGIFRAALLQPVLTSPMDFESSLTRKPTFEWQSVPGAETYTIQISRSANLSSPIVNAKVNTLTYTPINNLPNCSRLYWRVRANGQTGAGIWSEKQSFFVNPEACAYSHLYTVMDTYKTGNARRLLESYKGPGDGDTAWVYDNALAMIALMSRGGTEDWSRAKVLADTFVYLQDNDPAHDGRLRDAYHAVNLTRATKQTRTGDMAWAALALLRYYEEEGGGQYLTAATEISQWIYDHTFDDRGVDGYTGGFAADTTEYMWKGTEQNISVYVTFMKLYEATGDIQWKTRALVAKGFIASMWNDVTNPGYFWTGTLEDGITTNTNPIPEDAQSWGLLALGETAAFGENLDWVEANLLVDECPGCTGCAGFKFSSAGSGCWWEGDAHMILAYQVNNEGTLADAYLAELRKVQTSVKNNNGKGIVAACPGGAVTGYDWTAPNVQHVGATAWFIFAGSDYNPLWGIGTSDPIPYEGEY